MQTVFRAFVAGLAVMSLAACGGGGGDGGAVAAAPVQENLAEITSENAEAVASAVMKATFEAGDLGSFANLAGGGGGDVPQKSSSTFSRIGQTQAEFVKPMLTDSLIGIFEAPIGPVEQACAAGGRVVVSGDLATSDTLSRDDVITFQFDACNDGLITVDGTMTITIRSYSTDSAAASLAYEVTVSMVDFSVTESEVTTTANGSMTLGMDFSLAGPITISISSEDLTITDGTTTESLASFSLSQTIDPVTATYSLTVSGSITSSDFPGPVNFETSAAFEGYGGDSAHAHLGQIVITGDGGGTITIDILDEQSARITVDADGDGVADNIFDVTWDELIRAPDTTSG